MIPSVVVRPAGERPALVPTAATGEWSSTEVRQPYRARKSRAAGPRAGRCCTPPRSPAAACGARRPEAPSEAARRRTTRGRSSPCSARARRAGRRPTGSAFHVPKCPTRLAVNVASMLAQPAPLPGVVVEDQRPHVRRPPGRAASPLLEIRGRGGSWPNWSGRRSGVGLRHQLPAHREQDEGGDRCRRRRPGSTILRIRAGRRRPTRLGRRLTLRARSPARSSEPSHDSLGSARPSPNGFSGCAMARVRGGSSRSARRPSTITSVSVPTRRATPASIASGRSVCRAGRAPASRTPAPPPGGRRSPSAPGRTSRGRGRATGSRAARRGARLPPRELRLDDVANDRAAVHREDDLDVAAAREPAHRLADAAHRLAVALATVNREQDAPRPGPRAPAGRSACACSTAQSSESITVLPVTSTRSSGTASRSRFSALRRVGQK